MSGESELGRSRDGEPSHACGVVPESSRSVPTSELSQPRYPHIAIPTLPCRPLLIHDPGPGDGLRFRGVTSALLPQDVDFEETAAELEDRRSSPPRYEIATYPADFTLEVLHGQWQSGDIFIPEFQRGFVWSQIQASKLIESFLLGLPVPSIFLYTERGSERSMVVDGQQRLRSICYFFEGHFGPEDSKGRRTTFRLKGLHEDSPFANVTFSQLEETDPAAARRLKNSVLRAFIIRQLNPNDDTSIFHVFERLNTGGTLLHNQEVRNAICHGTFNELLHRLNESKDWRSILGKPSKDSRMRDVELILRFFALRHASASYTKPMKDFMSNYMRTHANAPASQIESYADEFEKTCAVVLEELGAKPFHLYAGFNSSAFDSVFCAVSKHLDNIPSDLSERWRTLAESKQLEELVRGGTTDVDQVRGRLTLVEQKLFS
jgi:hypothetical protein